MAVDFKRLASAEIARAAAERTFALKIRLVVTAGAFGKEQREEIQEIPQGAYKNDLPNERAER